MKRPYFFNLRAVHFFLLISLFLVGFTSCAKFQHLAKVENTNYVVEKDTHPEKDSAILAKIAPYREKMDSIMDREIGFATTFIPRNKPDGPMNRLVGDMLHEIAEEETSGSVDFAVQNYFGLRINALPEGPITYGLIYELMPFENYLITLDVPGSTVKELCDLIASKDGWPVSKGLYFEIAENKAENISIDGIPLDSQKMYRIATNDYVANGGDDCTFLRDFEQNNTGVLIRDAIIEYIIDQAEKGIPLEDPDGVPRIIHRP